MPNIIIPAPVSRDMQSDVQPLPSSGVGASALASTSAPTRVGRAWLARHDASQDPMSVDVVTSMPNLTSTQGSDLLLAALWRSPDLHYQLGAMDRCNQGGYRNIAVPGVRAAVTQSLSLNKAGSDCYFACAEYGNGDNRKADNVVGAWAFWMDFDCAKQLPPEVHGYTTTGDIEVALADFCFTTGVLAPTHIVETGGGLHVYWALDGFVSASVWKAHAQKFKQVATCWGLHADPARTADIASVLRVPGTMNHKYSPARPVNLKKTGPAHGHAAMLQAIRDAHDRLCPQAAKPALSAAAASEQAGVEYRPPTDTAKLKGLLGHIDADIGYMGWLRALMAIFHETHGSAEGLSLAIEWSSGGRKFKGAKEIDDKWQSFQVDTATPVTIGTLVHMARAAGADADAISLALEPWEVLPMETYEIEPTKLPAAHPLGKYSLRGRTADVERQMVAQVAILGDIALHGQATALYASANTGKTLIVLHLIIDGIKRGAIDPTKVFYINMDDNSTGLVEKLQLADEYGFDMLADGYQEFQAKLFFEAMLRMTATDAARGIIVILDTLKKFVNTMDKTRTSEFAGVIRRFVLKGGTVIALAHTNKNPGADGRPVYSGTSDIVDDFDCAYTLATVPQQPDSRLSVVEFTNIKRRGNVALTAAYSFAMERDLSYTELLLSVREVDHADLTPLKEAAAIVPDAELIEAITKSIVGGTTTKMELARAAATLAKSSKRAAMRVLEKYTGGDIDLHRWSFKVADRGAKVFALLEPADAPL